MGQRGEATEGSCASVDIEALDRVTMLTELLKQPVAIACEDQILTGRLLQGRKRNDRQIVESLSARPEILFGRVIVAVPPDRGKVDRKDDSRSQPRRCVVLKGECHQRIGNNDWRPCGNCEFGLRKMIQNLVETFLLLLVPVADDGFATEKPCQPEAEEYDSCLRCLFK